MSDHGDGDVAPQLTSFLKRCEPSAPNVTIAIQCHSHIHNGHLIFEEDAEGQLVYTTLENVRSDILCTILTSN